MTPRFNTVQMHITPQTANEVLQLLQTTQPRIQNTSFMPTNVATPFFEERRIQGRLATAFLQERRIQGVSKAAHSTHLQCDLR